MDVWSELLGTRLCWLVFLKCNVFEYILNYITLKSWTNLWRFRHKNFEKLSMEIFYWLFIIQQSRIYFLILINNI